MDIQRIKSLIDLVAEEEIADLDVTEPDGSVRIVRVQQDVPARPTSCAPPGSGVAAAFAMSTSVPAGPSAAAYASPSQPTQASRQITAPMIGTFYRSTNLTGEPLVQVGAVVQIGTPLCVIEAMKIMNEIESDKAGTVTQVLCESGQAVDRGQPLFVIE